MTHQYQLSDPAHPTSATYAIWRPDLNFWLITRDSYVILGVRHLGELPPPSIGFAPSSTGKNTIN